MGSRLEGKKIPEHIAIILDGNGRWAKRRGLPRVMGHRAGCDAVEAALRNCGKLGVKYLTVYGFSTENWKRSEEEVSALMGLFRMYLNKLLDIAKGENCKCLMIGARTRFAPDLIELIDRVEEETKECDGITFLFAINYGGRDDVRRAVKKMMKDYADNPFDIDETVTEQFVAGYLDTAGIPDPDLLIRTSGELRISNFLIWQIAYSEIYVTDTLWPDFDMEALEDAIIAYNGRDRRFGGRKA